MSCLCTAVAARLHWQVLHELACQWRALVGQEARTVLREFKTRPSGPSRFRRRHLAMLHQAALPMPLILLRPLLPRRSRPLLRLAMLQSEMLPRLRILPRCPTRVRPPRLRRAICRRSCRYSAPNGGSGHSRSNGAPRKATNRADDESSCCEDSSARSSCRRMLVPGLLNMRV
jgi:hypothetical protein